MLDSISNKIKNDLKGSWPLLIYLLNHAIAIRIYFYIFDKLNLHSHPSSVVPWYFIIQDLVGGLVLIPVLLISIFLGLFFWRPYRTNAWFNIWMPALWTVPKIWEAMVILFKTSSPFDVATRITSWTDYNSYRNDPLILYGHFGWLVFFVVLGIWCRFRYRDLP